MRRFNVELGKAAQEPEHDRAAARVGEAEAGPAQGVRHGPAVLYNMMLGGAGGLQQLQDDDFEYEGMGRGYDPMVIMNDHVVDRPRRAGEDQRHERILDPQEIRLLNDLSSRLASAGVPACGETSDAVHQTSVLLRSIQLTMQVLARQASLRTRLARLGRERVVDRAARQREWRELVGRESARIKGTLASLKREVKLFVDMSSADSRVRLALRLSDVVSVPDNQGATMQVSPGPSGPRLSDGSMRASVPTCQEAVAVGGGIGAEDGTVADGGQAGAGAQEERSVATIVDEAVGGFLSDTLPESKTADPPFTGEWRRELHEKLVALVRRAYLGDRIPDQGLRDALRDVDWEAVALMAGGLDRSHLELLLQARLSPEERRELEKRREEEESNRYKQENTKMCPGTTLAGAVCGVPCERTEGCNTVGCTVCSSAWCWQCGVLKAYRGQPGQSQRDIVLAAEREEHRDRRCPCGLGADYLAAPYVELAPGYRRPKFRPAASGSAARLLQDQIIYGAAAQSLLEVSDDEARERLAQLGEELALHGAVLQLAGEAAAGGTASAAIRGICERALLSGVRLLSRLRARLKVVQKATSAAGAGGASGADGPRGKLLLAVTAALIQLRRESSTGPGAGQVASGPDPSSSQEGGAPERDWAVSKAEEILGGGWAVLGRVCQHAMAAEGLTSDMAGGGLVAARAGSGANDSPDSADGGPAGEGAATKRFRSASGEALRRYGFGSGGPAAAGTAVAAAGDGDTAEEVLAAARRSVLLGLEELKRMDTAAALGELGVMPAAEWLRGNAEVQAGVQELQAAVEQVSRGFRECRGEGPRGGRGGVGRQCSSR